MKIRTAAPNDLPGIYRLLRRAAHAFISTGLEDIAELIQQELCVVGTLDANGICAVAAVHCEPRPKTLPAPIPRRASVRVLALTADRAPMADVPALLHALEPRLFAAIAEPSVSSPTVEMTVFTRDAWLRAPLLNARFDVAERVEFLRLNHLQQRRLDSSADHPEGFTIQDAGPADIDAVATLDALAFAPRWHFSASQLLALFMGGRMRIGLINGQLVGYSVLAYASGDDAQLERLAVHPGHQGQGVGRHLLLDAAYWARDAGASALLLNTQTDNRASQALYRGAGFRATGHIIPLFSRRLGG